MDEATLKSAHEAGEVLRLSRDEWEVIARLLEVIETHPALPGSELLLVRFDSRLAAVEQPRGDEWAVRPLSGMTEAREFIRRRQAEHDRMWNGCGCRIDYYG